MTKQPIKLNQRIGLPVKRKTRLYMLNRPSARLARPVGRCQTPTET